MFSENKSITNLFLMPNFRASLELELDENRPPFYPGGTTFMQAKKLKFIAISTTTVISKKSFTAIIVTTSNPHTMFRAQ